MIYGLNTWLPQIMLEAGYPLGSALAFLLVFNIGAIIGTVLIATAADRFGSKPVTVATFLLAATSVALLGGQLPTLALYVLVALGGAGVIALVPKFPAESTQRPRAESASTTKAAPTA